MKLGQISVENIDDDDSDSVEKQDDFSDFYNNNHAHVNSSDSQLARVVQVISFETENSELDEQV